jgi:hypothetical protein
MVNWSCITRFWDAEIPGILRARPEQAVGAWMILLYPATMPGIVGCLAERDGGGPHCEEEHRKTVAWKGSREKQHAALWAVEFGLRESAVTHSLGTSHSAFPPSSPFCTTRKVSGYRRYIPGLSALQTLPAKSSLVAWTQEFDQGLGWWLLHVRRRFRREQHEGSGYET